MQKCGGWCTIRDVPYPPVAKLDIAVDSDSKGWGFKSLRAGQKRGCRFCGILFFSSEGAEPPRNFATQNAALFRESMRKQRRMAATGKCRSKSHRGGGSEGAEPPTQFCDAKCSTFPRKHEKTEADGSNGKVQIKSHRGGPKRNDDFRKKIVVSFWFSSLFTPSFFSLLSNRRFQRIDKREQRREKVALLRKADL